MKRVFGLLAAILAAPVVYAHPNHDDPSAAAGSLRAPFAGTHGWYWKNEPDQPVVIKLRVAGFHSARKKT